MLGKLLKHDLKSTSRVLLPLNLVLVGVTIFGMVFLSLAPFQRPETMMLTAGMMVTYLLMVVALNIITHIYLIVFFYRSLFTYQGYLTFTLPTTPWRLLHSKGLSGFFWSLLNTVLTFLSVLLLFASAVGFSNFGSAFRSLFTDNLANGSVMVNGVAVETNLTLMGILGTTPSQLLLFLAAFTLVSCLYSVAVGYGSVAIGQLFSKHKVAGTVISYLVIYFIVQFFCGIVSVLATIRPVMEFIQATPDAVTDSELMFRAMGQIYHPMLLAMMLFELAIGVLLYVASGIIMNKKVNLD